MPLVEEDGMAEEVLGALEAIHYAEEPTLEEELEK